jgi:hypothetical protein
MSEEQSGAATLCKLEEQFSCLAKRTSLQFHQANLEPSIRILPVYICPPRTEQLTTFGCLAKKRHLAKLSRSIIANFKSIILKLLFF